MGRRRPPAARAGWRRSWASRRKASDRRGSSVPTPVSRWRPRCWRARGRTSGRAFHRGIVPPSRRRGWPRPIASMRSPRRRHRSGLPLGREARARRTTPAATRSHAREPSGFPQPRWGASAGPQAVDFPAPAPPPALAGRRARRAAAVPPRAGRDPCRAAVARTTAIEGGRHANAPAPPAVRIGMAATSP